MRLRDRPVGGFEELGLGEGRAALFATVYRTLLEENAAGKSHPNVGPMLLKAGFRFLGDQDEVFDFVQKLADIVQRPIQQDTFDFGLLGRTALPKFLSTGEGTSRQVAVLRGDLRVELRRRDRRARPVRSRLRFARARAGARPARTPRRRRPT